MTKFRCLPLGLLAVVLLNAFSAVAGEEIVIDPWELKAPNQTYESLEAFVGDTITFSWLPGENHTVYINPSGTCNADGAIFIGDESPVRYTFTAEDAVNSVLEPVYFVDNIDQLCEWGMRFAVNVKTPTMSPTTTPPTTSPTTAPSDAPSSVPSGSPVTQAPSVAPSGGPTVSPSVSPSSAPTVSPSVSPSSAPSASPVVAASNAPTVDPSTSPSASPIIAASASPTITASGVPSLTPTANPSAAPSSTPTISPSTSPSTSMPSSTPTITPSSAPTGSPSKTPTSPPVPFPTEVPTPRPTATPTATPTNTPTVAPTPVPTNTPTVSPTARITAEPTNSPTRARMVAGEGISQTFTGVKIGVRGLSESEFSGNAIIEWQMLTEEHIESFVFNDLKDSVANYVTSIQVTGFETFENFENRRMMRGENRKLQEGILIVEYTQTVTYTIIGSAPQITPEELLTAPFETNAGRSAYVAVLRTSSNVAISGVNNVSTVQVPVPEEPAPEGFVWTRTIIIAVAAGGAGLLIVIILFVIYCRKGSGSAADKDENPPLHVDVRNDEVSTLAGPDGPPTYGDQSVATVDYDYSKAYGGAGDTSVSSAGGTFGSQTQNLSLPANAAATGAALGAMDSDSFDDTYSPRSGQGTEEIIHIFAPPGKLGVVIDTPDDGAPVVHAVKETSVIADRILVGDKLVAVDDEDVRSMTAIKVSKMISRKGANPTRKLTIVRTVPPQ